MWIIGDFSACIVLLSIIILIFFSYGVYYGLITSIPLTALFGYILYLGFGVFPDLKKSRNLLNGIMKEEKNDIEIIKEEWFNGGKNMVKKKSNYFWACLSFLILGFCFLCLAIYFASIKSNQVGFGLFTGGLALISIGIAFLSVGIANESDKKMQSIATADFYEITYRFWDRAPTLYRARDSAVRDTYSWQLGNLFRHGKKLKKWAEPEVQEQFIKEFKVFLERLRSTSCTKYWVEIKNYITTCKIAIEFETENDDMKNELIDELSNWIGRKEDEESNQKYLQRKGNEFSGMNNYDVFEMNNNQ